jgi:hypothetical protein
MDSIAPSAALIVTVDTEEEGLWGGVYRTHGNTVENIRGLRRFQNLCDRLGVRPSYLVTTPVAEDVRAADILRGIQANGSCEIGSHLHPWCAPPFEGGSSPGSTFLCNLPEPLQREKLARLTQTVEVRFGRRPVSFRAGRYGLSMAGARILKELGYSVDSSVIPFCDFSAEGGPSFDGAPTTPYHLDGDDLRLPHPSGLLLEVPVSVGFSRRNFEQARRLRALASRRPLKPLRAVGLLDRLGLARRVKFSPEQADATAMKRLADLFLSRGAPCLVMLFHSSSLFPGCSPYVPDARRLDRFHADLEETFEHCLGRRGMVSRTLAEFAAEYEARSRASRA